MKRLVFACCLVLVSQMSAQAMTWDYYKGIRQQAEGDLYILGVGEGIGWSNTRLEQQGQPILFCQPRDLAIEADMYDEMLVEAVDADPTLVDYPIELILLDALERTYPCKRK